MTTTSIAGLAAAVWLGCLLPGPWWLVLLALVLLAAGAFLARRRPRGAWALALVAMALVGMGLSGGRAQLAERGPLSALLSAGAVADIEAMVVTEPRPTARGAWAVVRVTAVDGVATRQRALLQAGALEDLPPLGARAGVRGRAVPLGEHGFHTHVRRLGAVAVLSTHDAPTALAPPSLLLGASTDVRDRARGAFESRLDDERATLLTGLTTGDVSGRPEGQRERFAAAGLSHLVVVSGKHTALMLVGVLGLATLLGAGARGRRIVGLAALAWFVVLVRWQPSVLRAGLMAALVLAAGLLGRAHVSVRLLWGAVLLLLLGEPLLATRLGFVLSVLATAGVLLVAPHLVPRLPGPSWLGWTAAATVGAQLGVAPVLLSTEGAVPIAALPANLVAGPPAAVAQAIGLASGALAQVAEEPAGFVAALAGPFLTIVLWSADTFSDMPAVTLSHVLSPGAALVVVAVLLRRHRRLAVATLAAAVLLFAAPAMRAPPDADELTVTALDIGQGDAILVESPHTDGGTFRLLYDGGPEADAVLHHLRERRIDRLDAVVLSHGHHDHGAGLVGVLEELAVGVLLLGAAPDPADGLSEVAEAVVEAATSSGVAIRTVAEGDRLAVGGAQARVLSPPEHGLSGGDLNENSVVIRIDGPHGSVLLTGDAEVVAQLSMLDRWPGQLAVDVLHVPHHGGATNAPGFLAAVDPRLALISVGADNTYGHPRAEVLGELAGALVLRTDELGTVGVSVTRDGLVVRRRRRVHTPVRPCPPARDPSPCRPTYATSPSTPPARAVRPSWPAAIVPQGSARRRAAVIS